MNIDASMTYNTSCYWYSSDLSHGYIEFKEWFKAHGNLYKQLNAIWNSIFLIIF